MNGGELQISSAFSLIPADPKAFRLNRIAVSGETVVLFVQAAAATAGCPHCGQPSRRVHSRYTRMLADLPWQGRRLRLQLGVRRFFCAIADCPRKIFAERIPAVAEAHARR